MMLGAASAPHMEKKTHLRDSPNSKTDLDSTDRAFPEKYMKVQIGECMISEGVLFVGVLIHGRFRYGG